jgi:hypothetical protein
MAYADTYTVFDVSGTDSQRSSDLTLGESGCNQLVCPTYVPGTFSGTALVDISTDTIAGATFTTFGGAASYTETFNTSSTNRNLESGLNLEISYGDGLPPYLNLAFNLSSDTVSGFVTGVGGSGESAAGDDFTTNMAGTLTPAHSNPPTAAPEIDPNLVGSGLALLIGGLAVLRGRGPHRRIS